MKMSALLVSAIALAFVAAGPAQAGGDAAAGKTLAKKCSTCHGANGEGKKKNPPLAGMEEGAFIQAMADYKSGAKENKSMKRYATKLSDDDVANLAAYYHSLK
ncbi:MAG: c-type cytochrome [Alphaproteobacteria bacterium]|nr:c-type cytochrome [Alphaproteobacteria bacterium]